MKSLLESVDRLDGPSRARIYRLLPEDLLEAVRAAVAVGWLPITLNVTLAESISASLGRALAHPFFRNVLLTEYQSSLLRPFVEGVRRAFGITPQVFVKMAPRGWELVYRECGVLEPLELGADQARLVLRDLPAACVKNSLWLDAVRSTFYTAFDLSNLAGEIHWDELDLEKARATMRFRW